MNQMLARLDQADASTRRFVSDASHELRSPLATIRAAIEVSAPAGHRPPDPERDDADPRPRCCACSASSTTC